LCPVLSRAIHNSHLRYLCHFAYAPCMQIIPCTLLASLLFTCGGSSVALAQGVEPDRPSSIQIIMQEDTPDADDFIVGPPRSFVSLAPGEERTVEIHITNREGSLAAFDLTTEDFASGKDQDGLPIFYRAGDMGPHTARLWIKPEVARLELRHGERAFLRVKIAVPPEASAGDHQAAVIVTRDTESQSVSGFNIVSRVAALFIITVEGDVVRDGGMDALESLRRVHWFLPASLRLTATNRGTVYMLPQGVIAIRNIFGMTVDEIPLRDWVILRESSRMRPLDWAPRFALGYYTATTALTAFDGQALPPVSATFWVIPIVPVILFLLLIFLVSLLVQLFFSRFEIKRKKED
jgi:hypothetical protein